MQQSSNISSLTKSMELTMDKGNLSVLGSLGVNCIWYEQHEDLPKLINSLL